MTPSGISEQEILVWKEVLLNSEPTSVNYAALDTYEMLSRSNRKKKLKLAKIEKIN